MTDRLFKTGGGDKLTRIETFPIEFTIDTTNDANESKEPEPIASEFVSITTTTENSTQNLVVST